MMTWTELQDACRVAATAWQASPPDALELQPSLRARLLWLLNEERNMEPLFSRVLASWIVDRKPIQFPDEQSFFLCCRMLCNVETLDILHALGLTPAVEESLKRNQTSFLTTFLISSWAERREAWWMRMLGRMESRSVWVDPERGPAQ